MQSNDEHFEGVVLGLDVGDVRIGVARAHTIARLPEPLTVIDRKNEDALARIASLIASETAGLLVIGLPVLPSGDDGLQARAVREFVASLSESVKLPYVFVDGSFTSAEADTYLASKQWKDQSTNDAIAACLIIERYFTEVAHV